MENSAIKSFKQKVTGIAQGDHEILGIAVAGSAISGEVDEYSDLDLIIVTQNPIAPDAAKMKAFAARFPGLVAAFTGEHVGERRLLICLYEDPLLHVDFKFLQIPELTLRVENPLILWERDGLLTKALAVGSAQWPLPDFQWIEDRFWVWVHYAALKIGRGELFETMDCLNFLRGQVLGPLLHLKYGKLPRGVRKLERLLDTEDLSALSATVAAHDSKSVADATAAAVKLYKKLRAELYDPDVKQNHQAEKAALSYFESLSVQ